MILIIYRVNKICITSIFLYMNQKNFSAINGVVDIGCIRKMQGHDSSL
jgi:hypothetical protein